MTNPSQAKALTATQIDFVLCDIATTANQVEKMISAMICGGVEQLDDDVMLAAMQCMVQRIGCMADMAMMRSEKSSGPCFGDAAKWMMPPLFHSEPASMAGLCGGD